MAETVTLSAERRQAAGKGAARQLRLRGQIPAVIYGHGRDPESLTLTQADVEKVLHHIRGSALIDLTVEGQTLKTVIREVQRHPTRKNVTHVDFFEIRAGERLSLDVPVSFVGIPDGVRNAGGVLEQFLRMLTIEVLPSDIPEQIEVDVNALRVGQSLHVRDLVVPNAKVLADPDTTVCTVVPPRVEEAPPLEGAVAEVTEPELIRKPKAEEEAPEGEESEE